MHPVAAKWGYLVGVVALGTVTVVAEVVSATEVAAVGISMLSALVAFKTMTLQALRRAHGDRLDRLEASTVAASAMDRVGVRLDRVLVRLDRLEAAQSLAEARHLAVAERLAALERHLDDGAPDR
ncbi:MAG: hypothetical protein D6683_03925 [Actinomyces sp.]|nr:MAG: hypothetical protein D6683_03925 [Actinomyces sp.]